MSSQNLRILCVSGFGVCRAIMMHAFLEKMLKEMEVGCDIQSTGIYNDSLVYSPDELTVTCMEEIGIPLDGFMGQHIDSLALVSFSHIVCAGPSIRDLIDNRLRREERKPMVITINGVDGVQSPKGYGLPNHRRCRDKIAQLLPAVARQIFDDVLLTADVSSN